MSSFIYIYRAGSEPIPPDDIAANRQAWRDWNLILEEDYGIRTATGKIVTLDGVYEYTGDVRGASMVEFDSLDAAVEFAKQAPNLAFGGSVEVLGEYQVPS
jgi:hypothetical protein